MSGGDGRASHTRRPHKQGRVQPLHTLTLVEARFFAALHSMWYRLPRRAVGRMSKSNVLDVVCPWDAVGCGDASWCPDPCDAMPGRAPHRAATTASTQAATTSLSHATERASPQPNARTYGGGGAETEGGGGVGAERGGWGSEEEDNPVLVCYRCHGGAVQPVGARAGQGGGGTEGVMVGVRVTHH